MNKFGEITKSILRSLSNYPGGYAAIYNLIYDEELGRPIDKRLDRKLKDKLSKLKRMGLIASNNNIWSITKIGKDKITSREPSRYFTNKYLGDKRLTKNSIVVFDIPEKKRKYRDWLRNELVNFGYDQIQKSVWFGPSLPKEFIKQIDNYKILNCVKFFKAKEEDII